jgi:hypothetical protein
MTKEEARSEIRKWSSEFIASEKARIDVAQRLVKIIDSGAMSKEEISDETKVPIPIINRIESIGRRKMHPYLLFRSEPQYSAVARMPIDEQARIIKDGVEILSTDGSILRADLEEIQPMQAKQVFSWDRIRSVGEQKKWIEEQKTINSIREVRARQEAGYRIVNGKLVVGGYSFSRQELKNILLEM